MTKSRTAAGIGAALGMLMLILDGKTALFGASQGIEMCIRTVIPSLFPFFVLSAMLTSSLMGSAFPISFRFIGVPKGAESLVLTGFLGGYPVGAQSIHTAYQNGQLSREQAERMLGFCNNAGPSFLFGMIAPMFPSVKYTWMLWGIHIVSAFVTGMLLPKLEEASSSLVPGKMLSISDAVMQSIRVMASVCGWIVVFRVVIAFLEKWLLWLLPTYWKVAATGLLELANGCCSLYLIEDIGLRFLICAGILSFGGLCVTMQTVSVTQGLSLGIYFPGKLLQTALSVLFAWLIFPSSPPIVYAALGISLVLVVFLRKMQNNSSIPQPVGV